MDITIKDLTGEQADTVRAFAHAVKTGSFEDIELFNIEGWSSKKNLNFFSTLNYRIKPQPSYLDLHEASGLKVGDRVKITVGHLYEENGYKKSRKDQSDIFPIRRAGEITYDEGRLGFWVDGEYLLPYYALEKIEEEWIIKIRPNVVGGEWSLKESIYKSEREARQVTKDRAYYEYEIVKIK